MAVFEHLDKLLRSKGLRDNNLEDVFGEPLVRHHKPALLPTPFTPRILHLPPNGLAGLGVDVYAAYDHRVRHGRLVDLETLRLGHTELDVESGL